MVSIVSCSNTEFDFFLNVFLSFFIAAGFIVLIVVFFLQFDDFKVFWS